MHRRIHWSSRSTPTINITTLRTVPRSCFRGLDKGGFIKKSVAFLNVPGVPTLPPRPRYTGFVLLVALGFGVRVSSFYLVRRARGP